jgi:hypothetical protein
MLKLQKILAQNWLIAVFALTALMVSMVLLPVQAQRIGIEPFGLDKTNPNTKAWFIYNIDAGTKVDDFALISNESTTDTKVVMNANDGTVSTNGDFALVNDEAEDTLVGSWVSLSQTTFDLPANTSIKVPFSLTVPAGTPAGDYSGGLSIVQVNEQEQKGGVATKLRMGARIYVTVKGDLKLGGDVSGFKIINPTLDNFRNELKSRGFIGKDNMVMKLNAVNTGNVFGVINTKVNLTMPDGGVVTKDVSRDLIPKNTNDEIYIQLGPKYMAGTTKAVVDYEITPLTAKDVKIENNKGTLDYSFTLTDEDVASIDRIKNEVNQELGRTPDVARSKSVNQENNSKPLISPASSQAQQRVVAKNDDSKTYVLGSLIILLVIVLIIVLKVKVNRGTDAKTESKIESKTENKTNDVQDDSQVKKEETLKVQEQEPVREAEKTLEKKEDLKTEENDLEGEKEAEKTGVQKELEK